MNVRTITVAACAVVLAATVTGCSHAAVAAVPAAKPAAVAPAVTPAATPTVEPPDSYPPIYLRIDTGVDPEWHVATAARLWNEVTGCDLFTLTPRPDTTLETTVDVRQVVDLTMPVDDHKDGVTAGDIVWGLTTYGTPAEATKVELNPLPGVWQLVVTHELGHVLGLPHNDIPRGVMNNDNNWWPIPVAAEVAAVRAANSVNCPAG